MYFVVIVEPEEVNAERIRAILESVDKNFEYELTPSPEKAIEIVENKKVDVFISSLELTVMTGAELFSMIEMLSPETVRIAMTSPDKIVETVACMNQCKTFKVIIKPCRVADDLLSPIDASITYKEMCEKVRKEEEDSNRGLFATEQDLKKMEISWREKLVAYQRIQAVLEKVVHTNIELGEMDADVEAKLKKWYDWILASYVSTMIDSDGQYDSAAKNLASAYHEPDEGCCFQMKKNFKEKVLPQKMNEMTFMLRIVLESFKRYKGTYKIAAVIEDNEKAYILRIVCRQQGKKGEYMEPNEKVRAAVVKAAGEAIAAFGNKSVTLNKEDEVQISVALRK